MPKTADKIKILESQALKIEQNFLSGLEFGKNLRQNFPVNKQVIACGMGGSILAAELASENFVAVVQDYFLPKTKAVSEVVKNKKTAAVFCFSYSGNTEETLSCVRQAKKLGLKTFGFSRGGRLEKEVDRFFRVPDFQLPRFAVPYWFGLIQGLFASRRSGQLTNGSNKIRIGADRILRRAKDLAKKLRRKNILIYAPARLLGLAHFWEVNLDETAKTPSFVGWLPDIDHHDIASFSRLGLDPSGRSLGRNFISLFLDDSSFSRKRIQLTAKIFKKHLKIDSIILPDSRLAGNVSAILSHLLLIYLTSLTLAKYYRVDPFENFLQEKLKKELKNK